MKAENYLGYKLPLSEADLHDMKSTIPFFVLKIL